MSPPAYPAADLDLARQLERAEGQTSALYVQTKARLRPESGAACLERAGVYAMFDGPGSPLTQTFGLGLADPHGEPQIDQLQTLEDFFLSRGAPVDHEVSPLVGVAWLALLANRGYRPIECTSVMYRPIAANLFPAASANPGLSVRQATHDEHPLWASTAAEGWREAGDHTALMADLIAVFAQTPCWKPFLAFLNGRAIATAALSLIENVALLAGASTVPTARRQGAQLALLDARLQFAAEHGCELAMMCAAPGSSSQRNAERHGFRIAYTRIKWRLQPPPATL